MDKINSRKDVSYREETRNNLWKKKFCGMFRYRWQWVIVLVLMSLFWASCSTSQRAGSRRFKKKNDCGCGSWSKHDDTFRVFAYSNEWEAKSRP
ncbi:MAG: hypothetical protein PHU97_03180 [Bacteroidales bacterium]|nr:hypothetical protein [Bacteroidales bacterium]MDD3010304.1 hypothetical protein [Bacteroidales bacterium]MDD3961870.1 hypothetical protein [Bacteroidales bacterium]MDY0286544.1 hypothetical protein [Bacteroidales bacterium]HPE87184.1 hypothetical protein [Bacteroidales bacterium]